MSKYEWKEIAAVVFIVAVIFGLLALAMRANAAPVRVSWSQLKSTPPSEWARDLEHIKLEADTTAVDSVGR